MSSDDYVTLVSAEGFEFVIERRCALMSGTIKVFLPLLLSLAVPLSPSRSLALARSFPSLAPRSATPVLVGQLSR